MRIFPAFRSWVRLVVIFPLIVLAFGGYRGPSPAAQEHDSAEERRNDDPIKREQWFYNQRAYPMGRIPGNARLNALQEFDRMLERERRAVQQPNGAAPEAIAASATIWTPIGPQPTASRSFGNTSGRITALAVDPTDPNRVFAGGAQGGVWRSLDAGATWTPLTDFQPSLAVGSIAVDPTNSSIVYVGTGEENFAIDSYYGAGILKTTNALDPNPAWTQLGQGFFLGPAGGPINPASGGARIGTISIHPANNQILLAAVQGSGTVVQSGVWRSADGGSTWTHVLPATPRIVATDVVFDPAGQTGMLAYAGITTLSQDTALGTNNGVYKSTDGGLSWIKLPLPIPDLTTIGRIALAIAPGSSSTLFAAIADSRTTSKNLLGVFKTTNGGNTWAQLTDPAMNATSGFCNPQCFYDIVMRVSPANPQVVFAGGAATNGTLFRSIDGGNIWTEISSGGGVTLHVDQHAMAFSWDGSRLYVGNDGGAYRTDGPTATSISWLNLNDTLNITQFYPGLSIHPLNDQISFGGTQDNGSENFTGSLQWVDNRACGDGGWTAIDTTTTPSTVYTTCQQIDIQKSTQDGNPGTFSSAANGIPRTENGAFIPPFVMDPSTPQRLYFGTYRLWQTNDGASTWAAISGDLTGGGGSTTRGPSLSTIAVAPSDSKTVYVGTSDGHVQMANNVTLGSSNFVDMTKAPLPVRAVTQVAVDPGKAQIAYVTFSGFTFPAAGDTVGHVFKTTNSGGSWTDISGNLPNTPVNDIVIDPEDPARRLYVATDVGVFQTTDGGATWSTLVAGLPRVAVLSLKLREASRTLRAATHGRGVWDLTLPSFPDFSLSSPTGAQTISPGGSATYTVIVTPQNGFTSPVTLSCTNPPAVITCSSFNPQIVTPGNSATVTLTASNNALLPFRPTSRPGAPISAPWLILVALVLAAAAFAAHHSRQRRLAIYLPLAATVLLLAVQVAGCGGGGSSPPPPTPRNYTITVTGTAAAGASRTTTLTLIVR